jgi:hypothetical protein
MEKTLVIHPDDRSTDFLKPIYENLEGDVNVITDGYYKDSIRVFIDQADRVIMLGHGSPNGLFNVGKFYGCNNGYIVDETMIASLGNKPNNMYIWCNADKFVNRFYLKGFYSGMFISEYGEATYCNTPTNPGDVEKSNDLFSTIIGKNIMLEAKELCDKAKSEYYLSENKVAEYNNQRLYYK